MAQEETLKSKYKEASGRADSGELTLNPGTEEELQVLGYRLAPAQLVLTLVAILLTGGLLALPLYWKQHWWLRCTRHVLFLHVNNGRKHYSDQIDWCLLCAGGGASWVKPPLF